MGRENRHNAGGERGYATGGENGCHAARENSHTTGGENTRHAIRERTHTTGAEHSRTTPDSRKLYAAYGSNMNTQQMARRCPTATPAGTAELQGYRLLFRGSRESAVATVEPYTGGRVPVLLWELTPADESSLDRYEGYPYFYRKESVPLTLGGKAVTAMLYVMNAEGGRYPLGQPHPRYYAGIREGYMDAGLDTEVLRRATVDSAEG
jgi:gamma-glutamylcyclotransferase (GGCT)/AIG2-like uncharacterized protein YtfP